VNAQVTENTRALAAQGLKPGLAVALVGDDPASQVYVKSKSKAAQACGFHLVQHDLAATTSEAELLALVELLNADPAIHGILLQLSLPDRLDPGRVIEPIEQSRMWMACTRSIPDFSLMATGTRARAVYAGWRDGPSRWGRRGARR
jgi:methylenetetrahydrofolate dehydrogenase (NADP+)/methenyltetrahydrofolate cyclohydrolase